MCVCTYNTIIIHGDQSDLYILIPNTPWNFFWCVLSQIKHWLIIILKFHYIFICVKGHLTFDWSKGKFKVSANVKSRGIFELSIPSAVSSPVFSRFPFPSFQFKAHPHFLCLTFFLVFLLVLTSLYSKFLRKDLRNKQGKLWCIIYVRTTNWNSPVYIWTSNIIWTEWDPIIF